MLGNNNYDENQTYQNTFGSECNPPETHKLVLNSETSWTDMPENINISHTRDLTHSFNTISMVEHTEHLYQLTEYMQTSVFGRT